MLPAMKNGFWHPEIKQAVYTVYIPNVELFVLMVRNLYHNSISTETKTQLSNDMSPKKLI